MTDSSGYTQNFYRGRDDRSVYSARTILALLFDVLPPVHSVVDYGCGVGTWLAEAQRQGVQNIQGYEGCWLDSSLLEIADSDFDYCDFERLDVLTGAPRRDLAICLEVAEHLHPAQAETLVERLTASADYVLFSAAIPDQGGKGHRNERWPDYWAERFAERGYTTFAPFRRELWQDAQIRPWYRQNLLLCVKDEAVDRLTLDDFDQRQPVLPVIHPEVFKAALDKRQAQINALKSRSGAWRALRHALRHPQPASQPAGQRVATDISDARHAQLMATVPTLDSRQIRKHKRRYYQWRLPTAAMTAVQRRARLADAPDLKNFAIGLIALRPRYRRWARTLIHSIRAAGDYHGPIYVVTERPSDFEDLEAVQPIRVAATRHQLVAKTCKTFLLDWIPQRYVLYVDADILVGRPITQWCRQAVAEAETRAALFYPDPSERKLPFHGGLILMNHRLGLPLLREWRRRLASGHYRQDQEALMSFAREYAVGDLPHNGLAFPDEQMIQAGETACFIHLTHYRYRILGHERCLYYLRDLLGIADAEQRLDFS